MAKPTKKSSTQSKVTRISASDTASAPKNAPKKAPAKRHATPKATPATKKPVEKRSRNPLTAFVGYLKGSWHELKEVRWPTRRATWGMTLALVGFTAFFVLIILLLDGLFQWIFNILLGN